MMVVIVIDYLEFLIIQNFNLLEIFYFMVSLSDFSYGFAVFLVLCLVCVFACLVFVLVVKFLRYGIFIIFREVLRGVCVLQNKYKQGVFVIQLIYSVFCFFVEFCFFLRFFFRIEFSFVVLGCQEFDCSYCSCDFVGQERNFVEGFILLFQNICQVFRRGSVLLFIKFGFGGIEFD